MKPFGPPPAARTLGSFAPRALVLMAFAAAVFVAGIRESAPLAVLLGSIFFVLFATTLWGLALATRREHRIQIDTGWLTQEPTTYPPAALGDSLRENPVPDPPKGYRDSEHRAKIGIGRAKFERASAATLRWEVKTRAGFRVIRVGDSGSFFSDAPIVKGECAIVRFGPVRETVRVIRILDEPRRRGFAYGTLPEHPLRGEESFIVEWRDDDQVDVVIRSFSRPSTLPGWIGYPLLLLAQEFFVRRYLRALLE